MNVVIAVQLAQDVVNGKKTIGYVRSVIFKNHPVEYQEWITKYYNPLYQTKRDITTLRSIICGIERVKSLSSTLNSLDKDVDELTDVGKALARGIVYFNDGESCIPVLTKYSSDIGKILKEQKWNIPSNIYLICEDLVESPVYRSWLSTEEADAMLSIDTMMYEAQQQKMKLARIAFEKDRIAIQAAKQKLEQKLRYAKQDSGNYTLLILGGIL